MPLRARESRSEKGFHEFPRKRVADYVATQADYVQIVIFNPLMRRKVLMNQTRPYSRHLVGGDAGADASAADGHAAIHNRAGNRTGQGHDEIGIIIARLPFEVAKVRYVVTGRS